MNQTPPYPAQQAPTHWGPAQPPPAGIPRAGKLILIGIGVFLASVIVVTANLKSDEPKDGSDFYAAAGWTVQRAADLSVDLRRDAGYSDARADCTMKAIVGTTSWLEWRALSNAGQLRLIRTADNDC